MEQLRTELSDLESFVSSITPVNTALSTHSDTTVRKYLTLRRQYDYAVFVIALYASFERFTETLIGEYAKQIASFTAYQDLPSALTKKHLIQSAEMLSRKRLGEGRYANLSQMDVAENLFKCLSGSEPYSLTSEAVVSHDTNLRYADVGKLLSDVGVNNFCDNLPSFDVVWGWFVKSELGAGDESIERTPEYSQAIKTILENRLNDLVDRRNEVAHRGGSADELLGQAEMLDRIDLIRVFSEAMFATASSNYLKLRTNDEGYACRVDFVEGPYKAGTVVVIKSPSVPLVCGQPSFVIHADGKVRWGNVVGLKVDDESVAEVGPGEDKLVGVELNLKCNQNSVLWLNRVADQVVWAPA